MAQHIKLNASDWDWVFGLKSGKSSGNWEEYSKFVDFPWILATEKTKLLTGKGFVFSTKDKKLNAFFESFDENSHLYEEIQQLAFEIYYNGRGLIGFDRLRDGRFKAFVVREKCKFRLAKSYKEIIGVSVFKKVQTTDNLLGIIWERWNEDVVLRSYFYNRQELPLTGLMAKIPKEDILPEKEKNPWNGIIPFQDFPNNAFNEKPDWWGARALIKTFNKQMEYYQDELFNNRSRLVFRVPESLKKEIKNKDSKKAKLDYLITTDDEQTRVTAVNSALDFSGIEMALDSMCKRIFSLSGSSFSGSLSASAGEATATEISYNNSGLMNTIICSRTIFNAKMNIFLDKLFRAAGFENPEFTFYLKENTAINEAQLLEEISKKMMLGLVSKSEAISSIDNIPVESAEEKLKKIEAEREAAAPEFSEEKTEEEEEKKVADSKDE